MKILSFQPCSLYTNGGAGRLLRRLYQGHESQVSTIFVNYDSSALKKGKIEEFAIPAFPTQKSWMRWKLRPIFAWIRDTIFYTQTKRRVQSVASHISFDVLHIINHGIYSTVLCDDTFLNGKNLWVSFHDHFSLCSSFHDTQLLWTKANRRLVISEELGTEYQRLFGDMDFELITDGVSNDEISKPKQNISSNITIYFGGLLHIDYYPLFEVLANTLDICSTESKTFTLILRGTQNVTFLNNRKFNVEYRTQFISDEKIKEELDAADILYLPIKFSLPDFYLYSLSTKMIGYLGASGRILFHGPANSAAGVLLQKNNAAISCDSLDVNDMILCLKKIIEPLISVSTEAKNIAQKQFNLETIQNSFWNN